MTKSSAIVSLIVTSYLAASCPAFAMSNQEAQKLCALSHDGNKQAIAILHKAAVAGDANAQNWLGVYYGVKNQFKKAIYWSRKGALQGNSLAEFVMGSVYFYGNGVAKNDIKAAYWYRLAADQGLATAQEMLPKAEALSKQSGIVAQSKVSTAIQTKPSPPLPRIARAVPSVNTPTNHADVPISTTVDINRQATVAASRESSTNPIGGGIAHALLSPIAVMPAPHALANTSQPHAGKPLGMSVHKKAQAEYNLGYTYFTGSGRVKDYTKALSYFREAAAAGNADAETELGVAYFEGKGVPSNLTQANHWWHLAAQQGDHRASAFLGVIRQDG